ncbi:MULTISPECIES: hypothetical protein [Halomonas]|uniref:hypothetical protein n=1 Tax=Halomonas TaxID=2745 RepID=UPI001C985355|nr:MULTISPECIES: hypothetical protein [Halomonas]MBY6206919.1 hypothetical protein [Halomonas sp. DP3Y7-2]MBY6230393.1 hypothetical protein [Halomonas sp. DP3Y7-1]MCA0918553.1 hypothetical protein [Halomonas denitrificans]
MHPAKIDRITSLLHTSADNARGSLACMLGEHGADYTLEIATGALLRLEAAQWGKTSHRKVFASAARKALKQLEKGPLCMPGEVSSESAN